MGISSRRSSSKSYTNIYELTAAPNDNRVAQEGANIGGNVSLAALGGISDVNVFNTDYGAINKAGDLISGAVDSVLSFASGSVASSADVLNSSLANNSNILGRVLDFALADRSLSKDIQDRSLSAINNNLGSALDFATDSRLEDGGQSGDILKLAIIAAAGVGAVALFKR